MWRLLFASFALQASARRDDYATGDQAQQQAQQAAGGAARAADKADAVDHNEIERLAEDWHLAELLHSNQTALAQEAEQTRSTDVRVEDVGDAEFANEGSGSINDDMPLKVEIPKKCSTFDVACLSRRALQKFSPLASVADGSGTELKAAKDEPKEPPRAEFCGADLSGDNVVDCGCCYERRNGDQLSQAELLYNSGPALAQALARSVNGVDTPMGKVPVWTLGQKVPKVVCQSKSRLAPPGQGSGVEYIESTKPMCLCKDQLLGWQETQMGCGSMPADRCEHILTAVQELATAYTGSVDGVPPCTTTEKMRIPIGKVPCEEMSLSQCDQLFTQQQDGSFRFCRVNPKMTRMCPMGVSTKTKMKAESDSLNKWAQYEMWNPSVKWETHITADHTIHIDKVPKLSMKKVVEMLNMTL